MTEDNKSDLYAALSAAQAEMGHAVAKDRTNPHFKSAYATLGAVLEVAMPVLSKHGFALLQYREGDNLITELGHKSGQCVRTSYPLEPVKKDPQGWGSAMTYARRYQAMALLGLAPEDDDGNEASQRPGAPKQAQRQQQRPAPQQVPEERRPEPTPAIESAQSNVPEWAQKGAAWAMTAIQEMGESVVRERVFGGDAPADLAGHYSVAMLQMLGEEAGRKELKILADELREWRNARRQHDAA